MNEFMLKELAALNPDSDPITFSHPTRCNPMGWISDEKGCNHVVRLYYIGHAPGRSWTCPICGCRYPFAFWSIKSDRDFKPTPEQETDIRAMWADGKAKAENPEHQFAHGMEKEDLIKLWSLGSPPEPAAEEAQANG